MDGRIKKEVKYTSEGTPVRCFTVSKTYGCFGLCHKSTCVPGMYGMSSA